MPKEQGESIATYLGLNASQKQSVIRIYKAEEGKKKQKREKTIAAKKPSKETISARENAGKSKKNKNKYNSSGKNKPQKTKGHSSEFFLRIAYRKAESNPSIQEELKEVFTESQFTKWQELGQN